MAKLTAREILDSVKEMNVLELKEVVDLMKEELGVDPSAVAVAAAPAASVANDEPTTVTVALAEVGANKIAVIKLIQGITGLGLKDAKGIADTLGTIKENVAKEDADKMKADFEAAGAKVSFK